nr:nascent polypeptide-associated complex subunit alpha, muscle-specific form-like [Aegilops tauschii subsp. strangulata]
MPDLGAAPPPIPCSHPAAAPALGCTPASVSPARATRSSGGSGDFVLDSAPLPAGIDEEGEFVPGSATPSPQALLGLPPPLRAFKSPRPRRTPSMRPPASAPSSPSPSPIPARQCGVRRRPCAAACPVRSSGGGGLDFRAAAAPPSTGRAFKPGVCRPVPSRAGRPRRATPSQFHPLQKAHGGALLSLSRPQTPRLVCLSRPCALPLLQPLGPHQALLPPAACVKAASGLPACSPSTAPLTRRFGCAFLG